MKWPKIQITLNTFRFFFFEVSHGCFFMLKKYYIFNVMKHLLTTKKQEASERARSFSRCSAVFVFLFSASFSTTHSVEQRNCRFVHNRRHLTPQVRVCSKFLRLLRLR